MQFLQILVKVHYASSTIYFKENRLTSSQVSSMKYELLIFAHQNKGMYPPFGARPASKKKSVIYLR